ncbi:MAG: DMT family transporter, partial [Deltaproteobacteria bacterium]|nr:DMT family transporter [Deltaproteobacteria bacterium]
LGLVWNGMQYVSSGLAAVIASSNPLFVSAAALPLLGERISRQRAAGLVVGMAGVVFVLRNRLHVSGDEAGGIAMITGGMLSFVASTLLFKRWSPQAPLTMVVGIQTLSGGLVLTALGLVSENLRDIQLGPVFWVALAYNVLVVSIGAFALWFSLLRMGSASSASSLHFLNPPLGLLMGWALLGERVSLVDLLGILPIVLGILLVTVQGNPFKTGSGLQAPAPQTTPASLSAEISGRE